MDGIEWNWSVSWCYLSLCKRRGRWSCWVWPPAPRVWSPSWSCCWTPAQSWHGTVDTERGRKWGGWSDCRLWHNAEWKSERVQRCIGRRDWSRATWKPKQMVGMALKTAVQDEELGQTHKHHGRQPLSRLTVGRKRTYNHRDKRFYLVGTKAGVMSLSGQMYLIMTTMVTYQVPITLRALQSKNKHPTH